MKERRVKWWKTCCWCCSRRRHWLTRSHDAWTEGGCGGISQSGDGGQTHPLRWTPCGTPCWRCLQTDSTWASSGPPRRHTLVLQEAKSTHCCSVPIKLSSRCVSLRATEQSGSGLCVRTAVQCPGWETVRVSVTAAAAGSCRRLEIKCLAPCLCSLTAFTLVEFGLDWWEVTNHSRWLISSAESKAHQTLKGKHILGWRRSEPLASFAFLLAPRKKVLVEPRWLTEPQAEAPELKWYF